MRQTAPRPRSLRDARILIVGVGGLGSPAALALAEAGVGTLGLVDPDRVELSNLHRQPLYTEADLGRPKVEAAAAQLRGRHPTLDVHSWATRFDADAARLVDGFDAVLDGTDSIAAKFVVNDVAVTRGVPLVHAGAIGTRAQLLTVLPGDSACYRCLFEEPPPLDEVPSCEDAGVLGPAVVLAGTLQACEALRLLDPAGPMFAGRLLTFDLRTAMWRYVAVRRRPACAACGGLRQDAGTQRSVGR